MPPPHAASTASSDVVTSTRVIETAAADTRTWFVCTFTRPVRPKSESRRVPCVVHHTAISMPSAPKPPDIETVASKSVFGRAEGTHTITFPM